MVTLASPCQTTVWTVKRVIWDRGVMGWGTTADDSHFLSLNKSSHYSR